MGIIFGVKILLLLVSQLLMLNYLALVVLIEWWVRVIIVEPLIVITKVLTNGGWHELDDLVGKSLVTSPPGVSDDSVTIILLIAEDKLHA